LCYFFFFFCFVFLSFFPLGALWGADGKVKHLERLYPRLAVPEGHLPTAIIGSPVQQLDVKAVVKASQAVSSEIVLPS
jgi:hypothetical protein